jgi:hypothetical protein
MNNNEMLVALPIFVVLYLVPWLIALIKKSPKHLAILVLILVSIPFDALEEIGLIGWLAGLIWALATPSRAHLERQRAAQTVILQSPAEKVSVSDEIAKLVSLKESGVLTDEEFQKRKTRLLLS